MVVMAKHAESRCSGGRTSGTYAGYIGYPFQKCVSDGALRSFSAPSLYLADGDTGAHIAVYCSVLERVFYVASTGY